MSVARATAPRPQREAPIHSNVDPLDHLGLVRSIARRYPAEAGLTMDDLVQEGYFGLQRAAELFEPARGFRFSTYASIWIRKAISTAVNRHGSVVSMSAELAGTVRATHRHLSDERDLPEALAAAFRAMTPLSLELPMPDLRGQVETLGESIECPRPEMDLVEQQLSDTQLVSDLLAVLTDSEQRAIALRFGLDGRAPQSLAGVATELGLSTWHARSVVTQAMETLRLTFMINDNDELVRRATMPPRQTDRVPATYSEANHGVAC